MLTKTGSYKHCNRCNCSKGGSLEKNHISFSWVKKYAKTRERVARRAACTGLLGWLFCWSCVSLMRAQAPRARWAQHSQQRALYLCGNAERGRSPALSIALPSPSDLTNTFSLLFLLNSVGGNENIRTVTTLPSKWLFL